MIDNDKTKEELLQELQQLKAENESLKIKYHNSITEPNQIEESLKISDERYRTIIKTAIDGFWLVDTDRNFIDVNESYCRMSGYCKEELLSMNVSDIEAIETPEATTLRAKKIVEKGEDRFETKHYRKDGTIFDVAVSIQFRNIDNGWGAVFIQDITEQKKTEIALRESEIKLSSIINSTSDYIWSVNSEDFGLLTFNAEMQNFFTTNLEVVLKPGMTPDDVFANQKIAEMWNSIYKIVISKGYHSFEYMTSAGNKIISYSLNLLKHGDNIFGISGFGRDITKIKNSEKASKESEERYKMLINAAMFPIVISSFDGKVVFINQAASDFFGVSFIEIDQLSSPDFWANPNQRKDFVSQLKENAVVNNIEIEYKTKKNGIRYTIMSSTIIDYNENKAILSILNDVTEQKNSEKALQESHRLLNCVFSSLRDAVFILDAKTTEIIDCNPATTKIFGYTRDEMIGKTTDFIHTDANALQRFRNYLLPAIEEKGYLFLPEFEMKRKDCNFFPTENSVLPLEDEKKERIGWISVVRDITDRKNVENALQKSEEKYRFIVDKAPIGIFQRSVQGNFNFCNLTLAKQFECNSIDEFLLNYNDITKRWADPEQLIEFNELLLKHGEVLGFENKLKLKSGKTKWFSLYYKLDSTKSILDGFSLDITERKKAENELIVAKDIAEENEKRFRNYFQLGLLGMAITSPTKGIIDVNDFLCEFLEYPKKELIQKTWIELTHPDDIALDVSYFNKVLSGELDNYKMDKRYISKFGKIVYVEMSATVIRKKDGIVDYFVALINNITERKCAEEVLWQSEARLSALISSMKDIIFEIDLNGCFEGYFAQENKSLYAQPDFFIGKRFEEVLPEDVIVLLRQAIVSVTSGNIYEQFEYQITVDNTIQWEHAVITPRYNNSNEFVGVTVVCRNITERKKAEEELLKSEKRYAFIAKNTADVIWTQNFDTGKFTYVSSSVHKLRGYTPDEVMNQTMAEALTPESLQKTSTLIQERLAKRKSGDTSSFTSIVLVDQPCKDGSVVSTEAVVTLVFDEKGAPVDIIGVTRDITERKKAEAILTKLFTAINYTKASIVITDLEGNIEFANPYFTQLTGYTKEEFTGANPKVLKSGIHTDEFYKEMWDTIKSGNTWEGEFCNRKKNGELYWEKSIITPIKNEKEEIINFVAVKSDITKEKKHEYLNDITLEIYEKSENLTIEEILKLSIELGIQLTNSEIGFFHFVNEDQETISLQAWSAKTMDICNVPTLDKHYPINNAGVWVDCFYRKQPVIHNDYSSLSHKKGLPEGHATLIRDLSVPVIVKNQVVAIFGVGNKKLDYNKIDSEFLSIFAENVWNVIRRKNSEIDTIKAKEKAEESDKLKTAFLQNISHEIRTPLNGIIGFTALLKDEDITKEEIKEYTEVIQQSGNRLIEIVNNVLDMSKIETGQVVIQHNSFSVNSMMSIMFHFFLPQANSKGLILEYQKLHDFDDYIIETDESKLFQILSNLVNNAIKFTNEGKVEFGFGLKDKMMQFYVKDTGIGIPDSAKSRVFGRFAQVNLSVSRDYEGAGLGLSICKGLVEILGGKIWFESEISIGTTFYFTLPANSELINNEVPIIKLKHKNENKIMNILIAEDDLASFEYLNIMLSKFGHTIIHAKNGEIAVELVKSSPDINLVLMDVKMPVMNGIEATKFIKQFRPELPIIVQTAFAFSEEKESILALGCDDYLSKPLQRSELFNLIEKYG